MVVKPGPWDIRHALSHTELHKLHINDDFRFLVLLELYFKCCQLCFVFILLSVHLLTLVLRQICIYTSLLPA